LGRGWHTRRPRLFWEKMKITRKLLVLILICIFLLLPVRVDAAVLYPAGQSVTLAWDDDQTDIESYEIILIRDGTDVQYGPFITLTKSITIARPKSGKYEVRVRGLRVGQYSDWHSSIDDNAMLKTGVKGKWKVYFKLLGPSGPIIITDNWKRLKEAAETAIRLEPDPDKKAYMEEELASFGIDITSHLLGGQQWHTFDQKP